MESANEEFKELLSRAGWNQSQAARNLDLPTASISRYVNDIDRPSKQTLRLFRMILEMDNISAHGGSVLRDAPVSHSFDDFLSEMGKLREQFNAVERAVQRLKPISSPRRGHKDSTYDPAKVPVPPAQAEFDGPAGREHGKPAAHGPDFEGPQKETK